MTVTDISISAAEIDYGRYQGIIPSVFTGNDQIFGSIAGDIIQAGTGNDEVYGYEGNDRIFGDEGNDFLNGENGNDQLFGGDGNDWLNGGAGNDWIVGGAGYDASVGGDGDDGVVFDAGDNLAATTGGAGYDILFVNEADTASALTFNLAAQGFEQAIISRTDTTNQAWVTNTNIYDTAWRLVKSEYINDNGTSDVYRFDPANTVSWSRIQSHYSADNTLDWEIIVNDDGSTKLLDFDINNTAVWYSRIWTQDAQGNTISDSFVLDAALAQRSNEVNAIAKKIFIDDGLI